MHSSAAENRKKHHLKLLSLGSRSFKIISVNTIKKHVISAFMVSNMSVAICIHFHDRQANSRKTHFLRAKAGTAIAHLSHRNSVCLSVRHMGGSVKKVQARVTGTSTSLSAAWKTLV